jgi:hypothetical protein
MTITSLVLARPLNLCVRGDNPSLGLRNYGLLQMTSSSQVDQRCLLRIYCSIRPIKCSHIVTIIQLQEQIARAHSLIVNDCYTRDEPTDFRSDYGDVAADISIIGALNETTNSPPPVANCCEHDESA